MYQLVGLLLVFGSGAVGFLFGRSRVKLVLQTIVVFTTVSCWFAIWLAEPYLIHNHALDRLPGFFVGLLQFSAGVSFISIPCVLMGWLGGITLRTSLRPKNSSRASESNAVR